MTYSTHRSTDSLDGSAEPTAAAATENLPAGQSASFARNFSSLQRGSSTMDNLSSNVGSPSFVSNLLGVGATLLHNSGDLTAPNATSDDDEDRLPPSSSLLQSFINCSNQANQQHQTVGEKINESVKKVRASCDSGELRLGRARAPRSPPL